MLSIVENLVAHMFQVVISNNEVQNNREMSFILFSFDVHESVHRDTITKSTNEMQLYRSIYYS